jgi:hypothetical protein
VSLVGWVHRCQCRIWRRHRYLWAPAAIPRSGKPRRRRPGRSHLELVWRHEKVDGAQVGLRDSGGYVRDLVTSEAWSALDSACLGLGATLCYRDKEMGTLCIVRVRRECVVES